MAQGTPGYDWDVTIDNGGGHVALACVSNTLSLEFASEDTGVQGEAGESNTLTAQRAGLDFEIIWPAAALGGGQQDLVDAFFAKTELEVICVPAGSTSGYNKVTFNGRVHNLSITSGGQAGTVRASGSIRNSDGAVVVWGTV